MTEGILESPHPDVWKFLTIATLSARDFRKAHTRPGFSLWADRDEFDQERQSLALCYRSAGVTAPLQRTPFAAFEGWTRLTGAPLDVDALDEFAAHWRYRANWPVGAVSGRFGTPGLPERNIVGIDGAQQVVVRAEYFARWRDAYARATGFPSPSLDAYATLVIERCIPLCAAWPRWAL